jgi:hypothetical protein
MRPKPQVLLVPIYLVADWQYVPWVTWVGAPTCKKPVPAAGKQAQIWKAGMQRGSSSSTRDASPKSPLIPQLYSTVLDRCAGIECYLPGPSTSSAEHPLYPVLQQHKGRVCLPLCSVADAALLRSPDGSLARRVLFLQQLHA